MKLPEVTVPRNLSASSSTSISTLQQARNLENHSVLRDTLGLLQSNKFAIYRLPDLTMIFRWAREEEDIPPFHLTKKLTAKFLVPQDLYHQLSRYQADLEELFGERDVITTRHFLSRDMVPVNLMTLHLMAIVLEKPICLIAQLGITLRELLLEIPGTLPHAHVSLFVRVGRIGNLCGIIVFPSEPPKTLRVERRDWGEFRTFLKVGHDFLLPFDHFAVDGEATFSQLPITEEEIETLPRLFSQHPLKLNLEKLIQDLRSGKKRVPVRDYPLVKPDDSMWLDFEEVQSYKLQLIGDLDALSLVFSLSSLTQCPGLRMKKEPKKMSPRNRVKVNEIPLSQFHSIYLGEWRVNNSTLDVYAVAEDDTNLQEFKASLTSLMRQETIFCSQDIPLAGPWDLPSSKIFGSKHEEWFPGKLLVACLHSLNLDPRFKKVFINGIGVDLKKNESNRFLSGLDLYGIQKIFFSSFQEPIAGEEDWAIQATASDGYSPLALFFKPYAISKMIRSPKIYPKFGSFDIAGTGGELGYPGGVRLKSYSVPLELLINQYNGNALQKDIARLPILSELFSPLFTDLEVNSKEIKTKWVSAFRSLKTFPLSSRLEITSSMGHGMSWISFVTAFSEMPKNTIALRSSTVAHHFSTVFLELFRQVEQAPRECKEDWRKVKLIKELFTYAINGDDWMTLLSSEAPALFRSVREKIQAHNYLKNISNLNFGEGCSDLAIKKISFDLKGQSKVLPLVIEIAEKTPNDKAAALLLQWEDEWKEKRRALPSCSSPSTIPASSWVEQNFPSTLPPKWGKSKFHLIWQGIVKIQPDQLAEIRKSVIEKLKDNQPVNLRGSDGRFVETRNGKPGWAILQLEKMVFYDLFFSTDLCEQFLILSFLTGFHQDIRRKEKRKGKTE